MQQYKYIKGSAEDFVGAPSWAASRAMVDHASAFVDSKDSRYIYIDGSQCGEEFKGKFISWEWGIRSVSLIAQREPIPEWNGDGLPQVGVEIEFSWNNKEWKRGVLRYASKYTILIEEGEEDEHGDAESAFSPQDLRFRPIRTEAERKREDILRKLTDAICGDVPDVGMATAYRYAERVISSVAAGKIPGVKLD